MIRARPPAQPALERRAQSGLGSTRELKLLGLEVKLTTENIQIRLVLTTTTLGRV